MAKISEDGKKLTLGQARVGFLFIFVLGLGGAAAAKAAEGSGPSFSFCFKTKFSKSKTAKNLVQAIGKSEYLSLFLQLQDLKTSFCFKGEGGKLQGKTSRAACSIASTLGYCIQLRELRQAPSSRLPPRFILEDKFWYREDYILQGIAEKEFKIFSNYFFYLSGLKRALALN